MADNYLSDPTWAPNGFVDEGDEAAQQAAYAGSVRMVEMRYSWSNNFAKATADHGDETYGGDSFQYIPTEIEMGAAIAMRNLATAGELPVQSNDPGMAQLLQSLYQRTAQFWQDLRQASGTGW